MIKIQDALEHQDKNQAETVLTLLLKLKESAKAPMDKTRKTAEFPDLVTRTQDVMHLLKPQIEAETVSTLLLRIFQFATEQTERLERTAERQDFPKNFQFAMELMDLWEKTAERQDLHKNQLSLDLEDKRTCQSVMALTPENASNQPSFLWLPLKRSATVKMKAIAPQLP